MVDELPTEVFRILVHERKAMVFKAAPNNVDAEFQDNVLLGQPEEDDELAARHIDLQLQTNLTSVRLQSHLIKTERDARTFIEEQGVNVLYLALGMLHWFEADSSQELRKAPLVLVPVALERTNVQEKFRLRYTEEDLDDNLSLVNKLKLEFGVTLPDMPSQEDLDLSHYFDTVEESLRGQPRWSVDRDAVALAFFSFGKLLMYRDLDEENWPEGRRPSDHPVIRTLFGEASRENLSQLPDDEYLDRHVDPAEVHQVVDADSSQTLALLDVKGGRNLVIQGPPGTGKSQTITNVIAEAVGHGKTVLFVAEKMAALEVVKRRLDAVGLGDACLELHSRKTNKRVVVQELDRTMSLGLPRLEEAEHNLKLLTDMRDRLNEYCEAMNTPIDQSGVTPYRAIGELVHLGPEAASLRRLDFEAMRHWTNAEFRSRERIIEQLQAHLLHMGVPSQNLFYGSSRKVLIPTEQLRIEEVLLSAQHSTRALHDATADLAAALKMSPPEVRSDAEVLCRVAHHLIGAPRLGGVRLRSGDWLARRDDLRALVTAGERYSEVRARYDEVLIPEAWDQDLLETRQHLATHGRRWWRSLSRDYRRARDRLNGLCRDSLPEDIDQQLTLIDAVLEAQRNREVIRRHETLGANLFGDRWRGEWSDWGELAKLVDWIVDLYREVNEGRLPEGVIDFLADAPIVEGLEQKLIAIEEALLKHGLTVETVAEALEFPKEVGSALMEERLTTQEYTFDTWQRNLDQLQGLVTFNHLSEVCRQEDLGDVLRQAESWPQAGSKLVDAFRYTWFRGLVERAFRERPALARFDRTNHEYLVERFRELDRLILQHNQIRVTRAHWQGVPNHEGGGRLGFLTREIHKKRRHLPIRKLMRRAGDVI